MTSVLSGQTVQRLRHVGHLVVRSLDRLRHAYSLPWGSLVRVGSWVLGTVPSRTIVRSVNEPFVHDENGEPSIAIAARS